MKRKRDSDVKIREAFNRLINARQASSIRQKLITSAQLAHSMAEEDRVAAAELDSEWKGEFVSLAKRRGEFALAAWLRNTPHSFEIQ
jgi:hypothetical protein